MEELKDKMASLDVKEEDEVKTEQKEDEDSDGSFHSIASDDETPVDAESSLTESSEQHLNPVVINPDDDYDTDDEASWLPADQHTSKPTRTKRRKERQRLGDSSESESSSDKGTSEHRRKDNTRVKENTHRKEDNIVTNAEMEGEENEDEYIDEEHLKDLEVAMTEEDRKKRQEESLKYKESGNVNFKSGKYAEAVLDYTAGLRNCPLSFPKDRAILYGNRAAARSRLNHKKDAIRDCTRAVELDEGYTKVILRRATLREEENQLDEAFKDYQRVLELDPSCHSARAAIHRLPPMIEERNEKLKAEMMGKLKDLGNMILRPFGLSTSNFELKQDPGSGGYNISFKQNPNS